MRLLPVALCATMANALCAIAICAPATALDGPRSDRFAAAAQRILARPELEGAAVGIDLRSLTRGEPIWGRNAERAFVPASNLKLMTLYLSFALLGPEHQFETPLIATGAIVEGGRLEGDLWVRGSGDPTLAPCFFDSEEDSAPLEPFVQALRLQGVREVRGDLVLDDRLFDPLFIPQGWPQDQLNEDYAAPVAALSLNGNCIRVRISPRPGQAPLAEMRPEVATWRLVNELSSSASPNQFLVSLMPPDAQGLLRVRGSVGGDVGSVGPRVPVTDPPLYFGLAFEAALSKAGVVIDGKVRRAAAGEDVGARAKTLYTRRSPLLPALELCGKESDNTIAEHLLKACAAVRFGKGSIENAALLVRELCGELGVASESIRIVDGSGLSRLDQVTPAFLTALLAKAYAAPWRDEYVRCLPISGVDGTLEKRMAEPALQYRVRAKTGFINQVSALSGFALSGDGPDAEVFGFSFLINGFKGANAEMKRVQDDLCRAIVALPR